MSVAGTIAAAAELDLLLLLPLPGATVEGKTNCELR